MATPASLNLALLRPAILQILRAVGFHGAKPSVVDAFTDIAARYMVLLTSRAVSWAQENHNSNLPDITDVRLAMTDCGLLASTTLASEEVWREILRQPLEHIPERNGLRTLELSRRDEEDTEDVQQFVTWFHGSLCQEIKRIAGHLPPEKAQDISSEPVVDYLTALKKKHSKTGEESRFQGTVLGIEADSKGIKIDGGPSSINDWILSVKERSKSNISGNGTNMSSADVDMKDAD